MGVKGLTTYFKDHRHQLSHTIELKPRNLDDSANTSLEARQEIRVVVDGWSLLYSIYNLSGEPWVYGGEYEALCRHVESVLQSWMRVGILPTIVFDGPTPPLKYPTLTTRIQDNFIRPANLFFRTSPVARSTPRSLAETRISPPLAFSAILSKLLSMASELDVEITQGEADSYIVSLAGKLGAYVIGNDSDFVVLNSEGYLGFIPLDEMLWWVSESSTLKGDESDEFQIVTKKKQKSKMKVKESRVTLGNGPLPPSATEELMELSLVLTVYEPSTLATHFALPTSLLPLLGAFIGNDYSSFDFFRSNETAVNRVKRMADTLSSVLKDAQSGDPKKTRKIARGGEAGVIDVIGTTAERLLQWRDPRFSPTTGEIDKITEAVVQSTLQYALIHPESLFSDDDDGSVRANSSSQRSNSAFEEIKSMYLHGYHSGVFHPRLMELFSRGICFPTLFLEDPDRECCARSIGRPIREQIWKIFVIGGGIPDRSIKSNELHIDQELEEEPQEDDDELVDVVEEYSDEESSDEDPLAVLRGRLQRLSFSDAAQGANEANEHMDLPQRRIVTEYVRRGARVAAEDCEVSGMENLFWYDEDHRIPAQLRPLSERLYIFLKVLHSDTPTVRAMAEEASDIKDKLLWVLVHRWVLQTLHTRAEGVEDGNRRREREKEKWTRAESEAFLSSLCEEQENTELPPIKERAIQLTAQVAAAAEAIAWLAQALLLMPLIVGEAERLFSGRRFHAALSQRHKGIGEQFQRLYQASTENLGNVFSEEKGKRGKKTRKEIRDGPKSSQRTQPQPSGMFGALAGLDTD
ncbi:hypothetical protein BU17DRAFT_41213 [Hysterangium stoloniferum]|nr:hypothetical protein BU17DRAFT_41213 [Hysterangium stoloniferum]